jgi:hypothetical protein
MTVRTSMRRRMSVLVGLMVAGLLSVSPVLAAPASATPPLNLTF